MTATKAGMGTYKAGWCTTGAAAWSHARCSHTYGHPPFEATCACQCHDPVDAQVDAAFAMVKTTCHNLIDNQRSIKAAFRRHLGPDFIAKLHAVYGDVWLIEFPAVQVPV